MSKPSSSAHPVSTALGLRTIPPTIDRYCLVVPLGRGGTGIVWAALDALGQRVALKLVPRGFPAGDRRRRSMGASRHVARIRHPNVVSLLDWGTWRGGSYLVMELVDGPNVASVLRDSPLPWPEATAILAAVASGLAEVHDCGILHRDIKPSNLLRTAGGVVKLADFGAACLFDRPQRFETTAAGTPHFMSPEQCRAERCDERADLYALGATYHALLTGRTPYADAAFADAAPLHVMFRHCSAPVPDPRDVRPEVPEACAAIVRRAMAKRPADRFQSAREMRDDARSLLREREPPCRI